MHLYHRTTHHPPTLPRLAPSGPLSRRPHILLQDAGGTPDSPPAPSPPRGPRPERGRARGPGLSWAGLAAVLPGLIKRAQSRAHQLDAPPSTAHTSMALLRTNAIGVLAVLALAASTALAATKIRKCRVLLP